MPVDERKSGDGGCLRLRFTKSTRSAEPRPGEGQVSLSSDLSREARGSSTRRDVRESPTTHLRLRGTLLTIRRLRLLPRSVPLVLWRGVKHVKMLLPAGTDFQDRGHVATPVAVIRGGPHGREAIVVQDREPFHAELVRSENVGHVVEREKVFDNLGAERVTRAAV
jgi:hypothetical protein